MKPLRIGVRTSLLARRQAQEVAFLWQAHYPIWPIELVYFITAGDKNQQTPLPLIGGKGLFTQEIEAALLDGQIDIAVHSLKDMPTHLDSRFTIGAIPPRKSPFDALISVDKFTLDCLPEAAVIGTSSVRRAAQLKACRPDVIIRSIRGNVDTRLLKLMETGDYHAIILAAAGLERLNMAHYICEVLSPPIMLPAPGQGALAIQCLAENQPILDALLPLHDASSAAEVDAERAFLQQLEAGCSLPVSAYAHLQSTNLVLKGRINSLDGAVVMDLEQAGPPSEAVHLGRSLALQALAQGAKFLLEGA